ncbi:HlyD family efflux transporter periplasmic adaptor subunit [Photobacterium sp. GJ3]|uniref:HlyD family secretion protein n=1 Tax=Photobacterium sp. GJ3 TaxID=2829502 RepID=UPI001B8B6B98|nr:HlyD family efflux transporter periplasmic adaptor subunit [Photobacterium sp. GJ3]QUJ66583.1 HlyD family efflux transporter periplasmic adaptor subunit [Photobacterium sp. GJ3]
MNAFSSSILVALALLLAGCDASVSSEALGTLERDRITLSATANEIIRSLPVAEGTPVKAGDILVALDSTRQAATLAQAKAKQAQAKAYLLRLTNGERVEDIAAAKAQLDQARARFMDAEKTYVRRQALVREKLISVAERDNARTERDAARAAVTAAQENLTKLTRGERPEDIQQAQAQLEAAAANVALQQRILSDLTVVATRDGILDSLPYNLGERVPVNAVVAVIQADTRPYARVYVPEPYRVLLQPGQTAVVHIDGHDQTYESTLRWIATEPAFTPYYALNEDDRARLVYLAEFDLPAEASDLPSGVPVQVEMPLE